MPCCYLNVEKFYEMQEKEEAEKRNITKVPDFYKIMKKECGVKETTDQIPRSGEQT